MWSSQELSQSSTCVTPPLGHREFQVPSKASSEMLHPGRPGKKASHFLSPKLHPRSWENVDEDSQQCVP